MVKVKRTPQEIQDLLDRAIEAEIKPKYFGMTFEQGILQTLEWLTDDEPEGDPLSD